jgi:hypothetical protein
MLGGGVKGISMVDEDSEVGLADGDVTGASETVPFVGLGGVSVGRASEPVEEAVDGGSSEVGMPVDVGSTSVGPLVPLVG